MIFVIRYDILIKRFASYINEDIFRAIHKTADKRKAYGIDKVAKVAVSIIGRQ